MRGFKAESDLESLQTHISSYSEGRGKIIPEYFKTSLQSESEDMKLGKNEHPSGSAEKEEKQESSPVAGESK